MNQKSLSQSKKKQKEEFITKKMITESDAKKFQKLYKIETGQAISSEESFECIRNLVGLLKRVYKPIKKTNYEAFSNKLRLKSYEKTMPIIYR